MAIEIWVAREKWLLRFDLIKGNMLLIIFYIELSKYNLVKVSLLISRNNINYVFTQLNICINWDHEWAKESLRDPMYKTWGYNLRFGIKLPQWACPHRETCWKLRESEREGYEIYKTWGFHLNFGKFSKMSMPKSERW